MKRPGHESQMDLADAPKALAQLAAAFEHFNEVHPHSSLKMRSPREFRRRRVEQMRHAQLEPPALHCEYAMSGYGGARPVRRPTRDD